MWLSRVKYGDFVASLQFELGAVLGRVCPHLSDGENRNGKCAVLVGLFVPYLPKTGLNTNSDRFAIPKTNPYSAAVAPFFSASEGKNGGCSEMSSPNAIYL